MRPCHAFPAGLLLAVLLGAPSSLGAAELEKYLPDDTDFILAVRVRPVLQVPLVKKYLPTLLKEHGLSLLKEVFRNNAQVQEAISANETDLEERFQDLLDNQHWLGELRGLLTDIILAGPQKDASRKKVLLILRGNFKEATLKDLMLGLADEPILKECLKTHQDGNHSLHEVILGETRSLFVSQADDHTMFISPSKKMVQEALAKAAGQQATKLKKEVKDLLRRTNQRHALWLLQAEFDAQGEVKYLARAGVRLGAEWKADLAITLPSTETALGLATEIKGAQQELLEKLEPAADQRKELAPLVALLRKVDITVKDKTIQARGHVPAATLEALLQAWARAK